MSTIVVEVTPADDDTLVSRINLTYRYWVPGNDPWTTTSHNLGPRSGDWGYFNIAGIHRARIYSHGLLLDCYNFRNPDGGVTVGQSGDGMFNRMGSPMSAGPLQWTIVSVS